MGLEVVWNNGEIMKEFCRIKGRNGKRERSRE